MQTMQTMQTMQAGALQVKQSGGEANGQDRRAESARQESENGKSRTV